MMIANPRIGAEVQVWYKKSLAHWFPLHGKIGTVEIVAKGKGPRNHGVRIDGKLYVIPCGNLIYPFRFDKHSLVKKASAA